MLESLILELTTRCNLDCRYCYNVWKRPGEKTPAAAGYGATTRTLKRAFAIAPIKHVTMSGGEPFLAERFSEVVLFSRMAGKGVTIITNGNAAGRDDYRRLIDLGVGLFELPLHSAAAAAHDGMTKRPGSWSSARRSILDILELGGQVAVAVVLTRFNAEELGATLAHLKELGVERVMLNRFNVGGRGIEERAALELSPAELRAAFAVANESAPKLGLSITSNVCSPMCVLDPRDYRNLLLGFCNLDLDRRPITLEVGGDIRFCNHSPVVLGNIFDKSFEELAATPYARGWGASVPARCADCSRWARCLGGCRAAAEQLGGSLRDADPIVPMLEPAAQGGSLVKEAEATA